MKLNGVQIIPPKPIPVVIPRDGLDLVFMVQPVLDYTDFEKLCPEPQPPVRTYPGGKTVEEVTDKDYQAAMDVFGEQRLAYMYLKSLDAKHRGAL